MRQRRGAGTGSVVLSGLLVLLALAWWALLWPAQGWRAPLMLHAPGFVPLLALLIWFAWLAWRQRGAAGSVAMAPAVAALEPRWDRACANAEMPLALLDAQGGLVLTNPAWADKIGQPAAALDGKPLNLFCKPAMGVREPWRQPESAAAPAGLRELEVQIRPAKGIGRWALLVLSPLAGMKGVAWLASLHDIHERKESEAMRDELIASLNATSSELRRELKHQGAHDALTGLPNRASFELLLEGYLRQPRDARTEHAVVFLDLDRFKIINDTAGHSAGDALLCQLADRLQQQLGPRDGLARLGGDEFGLLLWGQSLGQARQRMEDVLRQLAGEPFDWEGRQYDVAASVGIAPLNQATESIAALMGQADIACYAAKSAGRNRVSVYEPGSSEALERHREVVVVSELREMLESERCVLFAQRVVRCDDQPEQRYEVLVRMLDAQGQLLPPVAFIPAAEHYDLMAIVDRWVFESCLERQGMRLGQIPNLYLHLNVSANSLNDPEFVGRMLTLLDRTTIPAERLVFEVTETSMITNLGQATRTVQSLRERGCQIALDDFGVGLSSFNYLRTLPVDMVKVDGSFVTRMLESAIDRRIVRAIHQVAQELEARTIAEGIEDEALFDAVKSLGIPYAQGYALHEPEPLADVLDRLLGQSLAQPSSAAFGASAQSASFPP